MVLFWSSWFFWCCLDSHWFLLVLPKGLEEVSTGQATWFFSVVVGENRWIPLLIAHEKKKGSWIGLPVAAFPLLALPTHYSVSGQGRRVSGRPLDQRETFWIKKAFCIRPTAAAWSLWPVPSICFGRKGSSLAQQKREFFPSHLIFGRALKKFLSVVQSCLILPEGLSLDSGRISLPELLAVFRSRVGGLLLLGVRMQDAFHCAVSLVMGSQANLLSFYHPQGPYLVVSCAVPSCI